MAWLKGSPRVDVGHESGYHTEIESSVAFSTGHMAQAQAAAMLARKDAWAERNGQTVASEAPAPKAIGRDEALQRLANRVGHRAALEHLAEDEARAQAIGRVAQQGRYDRTANKAHDPLREHYEELAAPCRKPHTGDEE